MHLRAWVLTIAGNVAIDTLRRARPESELVETGDRRPSARVRGARPLDRRPPAEGARRRRAPLRIRPFLRPDRSGARLERGRGPAGRIHGRPPAAQEEPMTVSPDLDQRFREAAVSMGLVDMGFDVVESPIGPLFVAASDRGLAAISFDPEPESQLERLARIAGPCVLRSPRSVEARAASSISTSRESDARSTCRSISARCRLSRSPSCEELARVPYGETTTYGALAAAGRPPTRGTCRRHRDEPKPHSDRPPMPPGRGLERRSRRLRGRARPEDHAARARGGACRREHGYSSSR